MIDADTLAGLRAKLARAEETLARVGPLVDEETLRRMRWHADLLRAQIELLGGPAPTGAAKLAEWRARGASGPVVIRGGRAER